MSFRVRCFFSDVVVSSVDHVIDKICVPRSNHFDLVVLGSGPAAQKAAINAAKMKKKVAMVDLPAMLGGVCVHTGTIPSKTFREAILFFTGYRQRGFYGKAYSPAQNVSIEDILERVHMVENWEVNTIKDQINRNRIQFLPGHGKFLDAHHVQVDYDPKMLGELSRASVTTNFASTLASSNMQHANIIRGDKILVAVGSRPAHNPIFDLCHPLVYDSDQILSKRPFKIPRDLIVVGTGVIAIEYATMFSTLPGCRVTIVDEKTTFLDFVDSEIIDALRQHMRQHQTTFRLGEKVSKVETSDTSVTLILESGKRVKGDALFYAMGRQGNTDSLQLHNAGPISVNRRGMISVNDFFQTNVPHIFAAGDCIGFPALASTAMEQGRLASAHMFADSTDKASPFFPYGIYSVPEISVIGKSEQQLTAEKIPYEIGVCKFSETAKGAMYGLHDKDADFLKLLFDPESLKLLGAHCIGESASEIIHIAQVVMSMNGSIKYFIENVFNYPTFAEAYRIAALDGYNRVRK